MIILNADKLTDRQEAHLYLQKALAFPDYYGRNLDALYDCLTDLDEIEVEFINTDEAEGTYFDKILQVFEEAAEDNARLTIVNTPAENAVPCFKEAEDYLEPELFGDEESGEEAL